MISGTRDAPQPSHKRPATVIHPLFIPRFRSESSQKAPKEPARSSPGRKVSSRGTVRQNQEVHVTANAVSTANDVTVSLRLSSGEARLIRPGLSQIVIAHSEWVAEGPG